MNASTGDVIGGPTAAQRNIISGNWDNGVRVTGNGTLHTQIVGNYIGTNATGTSAVGNANSGVLVLGSDKTTIGVP